MENDQIQTKRVNGFIFVSLVSTIYIIQTGEANQYFMLSPSIYIFELYLSWLGQHSHGHGAGVHPPLLFSPGNPLNSVNSGLKLHLFVALGAADASWRVAKSTWSHRSRQHHRLVQHTWSASELSKKNYCSKMLPFSKYSSIFWKFCWKIISPQYLS